VRTRTAVILAAGQGRRMDPGCAKVLLPVGGRPMVLHVLDAARAAGASRVIAVIGCEAEKVRAILPSGVETVLQTDQLGTGHATRCARPLLDGVGEGVWVLCGDSPLVTDESLRDMAELGMTHEAACVLMSFLGKEDGSYGRVVRGVVRGDDGRIVRIVERRDASEREAAIREFNAGTYWFHAPALFDALERVDNANAQGEYYLTDVVGLLVGAGSQVLPYLAMRAGEGLGVNSPEDLHRVEEVFLARQKGDAP
jgi:bifunctional UDP-N-acetylglucosamine pyrophosphorylase/glucosamine-1-phosphate N-acetyltransferase